MTPNIPSKLVMFAIDHTARTFREEDMLFCSLMKIIESVSNCLVDFKSNEIVTEISKTRHRQEFELKMSSQVERCAKWLLRATPSRISH